eukprot:TRINITY_DN1805_c0_g1_i4.p1 TRINITY_DN1805_c0_g1~~TRINITY_DN1805_c0_g1_i4.p1  ORF type:complete len:1156 (-),score=329.34 TRINITY_DN1805_c0_g1_i4:124-3591(-)
MKKHSENAKATPSPGPGRKKKNVTTSIPPVQSPQQKSRRRSMEDVTTPTSPLLTTPTNTRGHHTESPSPQRSPGGHLSNVIEVNGQEFFWIEYQPSREPTALVEPDASSSVPTIRRRLTNLLIPPLDIEEELYVVHPENEPEDVVEELSREAVCVVEGRFTKRRCLELLEAKYREVSTSSADDAAEKDFVRPSSYIRYFEKLPDEVMDTVEYDMDSEDEAWLANFNKGRRNAGLFTASEDDFEKIIDRLEKETFNQQRMKLQSGIPIDDEEEVTDVVCCVCNDDYSDDTNLIVFCDGCNISVHQDCYGIVHIPEGRWLCQKCEKKARPQCILCPNDGGAYKQTSDGKWAHVSCALWIPETGFAGVNCTGSIVGVNNICKARWKLVCTLCKQKKGACVQCRERTCAAAFHVTCGQQHHLCLTSKEGQTGLEFLAYCEKHTPAGYKRSQEKRLKTQKVYKRPAANFKNLEIKLRKSVISLTKARRLIPLPSQIVEGVFEYWLSKRKRRSGLPLLRSLTAIETPNQNKKKKEVKKTKAEILEDLVLLRKDFERMEFLIELIKRREKTKRDLIQTKKEVFELRLNPVRSTVEKLLSILDKEDDMKLFQEPVDPEYAPNYLTVVTTPMDFSTIKKRFSEEYYATVQMFWTDFELMCNNAILYNAPSTVYCKEARRLLSLGQQLQKQIKELGYNSIFENDAVTVSKEKRPMPKRKRDERSRSKSQEREKAPQKEKKTKKKKKGAEIAINESSTSNGLTAEDLEVDELLFDRRRSGRLKSEVSVQDIKPKNQKKEKVPKAQKATALTPKPQKRKYTKRSLLNGKSTASVPVKLPPALKNHKVKPSKAKPTTKQLRFDDLTELKYQLETSDEEEGGDDGGYPTRSKQRKSDEIALPPLPKKIKKTKTTKTKPKKIKTTKPPSPVKKLPIVSTAVKPVEKKRGRKKKVKQTAEEVPRVKRKYTKRKVDTSVETKEKKIDGSLKPKRKYTKRKVEASPTTLVKISKKLPKPSTYTKKLRNSSTNNLASTSSITPTKQIQKKKTKVKTKKSEIQKNTPKISKREVNEEEDEYVAAVPSGITLSSKLTLGSRRATKPAVQKKQKKLSEDAKLTNGNDASRKKKRVGSGTPPPAKKIRLSSSPTRPKASANSTPTINGKRKYKKRKKV